MRRFKTSFLFALLCLLAVIRPVSADESALRIVTSFTILEDLVRELGGEHVSVVNLVPRNSDAHMYRPKPSDSVAISNADLVVFNGLGFEGWIDRLIKDTRKEDKQLVASTGVSILTNGQEIDPHAWQSFGNIRIYVRNISGKLISLNPQYADNLEARKDEYLEKINQLEHQLQSQIANTPVDKRIIVTSHDAFGYLGRELGIKFLAPIGLSLDAEASALDVASVIDRIRELHITGLFIGDISNSRLLEIIAAETDATIGGRLYSDALSEIDGPAATYLEMMSHNIGSLIHAFGAHQID